VDELLFKPAGELAGLVRGGHVAPRELVAAAIERIGAVDGRVNAFVESDGERALAAAAEVKPGEQPFAGVPIAIKANTAVAGGCVNFASRFLAGHRPDYSAYLVRRLRDAGFVVVGTTNMPEFGILPTTEPRYTGATRNPWDLERTPGGSSGGAAAAVAGGMVPVAHGNDGGGSLRTPAACCGLVGLKPSRGRISRGPELGDDFLGADGVLTRTVLDSAVLLDVLAGYEVGDATWAPRPVEPYLTTARRDPGRLRVGMSAANPLGVTPVPESLRGMTDAGQLLQNLGHEVEDANVAFPGPEAMTLFTQAFAPKLALAMQFGEALAGRPPQDGEIEPLSAHIRALAGDLTSHSYLRAVAQLQALARGIVAGFADVDVLLTPALAERPLAIGELTGCGEDPWADFGRSGRFTPYTAMFNVTGQPAITVPVGFGPDGLPTAVQLVGRPLSEDVLLQVATQMEIARPWAEVRPPALSAS
jgi:amidase